jgi:FixJ family two-component response regulator
MVHAAGAVGFLNKPVERDRVLSVLRGALERSTT